MKNIAKTLLINTLIVTLGLSSFSLNALAEQNQTVGQNNFVVTDRDDLQKIIVKVINIDVGADKDPKNLMIKALGTVSNHSNLYLKNIKMKLRVIDKSKKLIEEIPLEDIDKLDPGQEKPFSMQKYVSTSVSPYDIRSDAHVDTMDGASLYQVAQWFVQGKSGNLKYWDIPFDERYLQNGSWLRKSSINMLLTIDKDDKNYDKSIDMLNELNYTESLVALAANDYKGAFNHLTAMNPQKIYGDRAEKLIEIYRSRVLYEKAKPLIAKKKYINVIGLLRSIPPGTEYYDMAQTDLKNIYFYFHHRSLWANLPDMSVGSDDQKAVLKLMETTPELVLKDSPSKNLVTWIFPDYSRFNFDEEGKLLNYKVYPLY